MANNQLIQWRRVVGSRELLSAVLQDNNGSPINLTGRTITFDLVNSAGTAVVSGGSCTIVSALDGSVYYAPAVNDLATAGTYAMYFKDANTPSHRWPHDGARWQLVVVAAQPES